MRGAALLGPRAAWRRCCASHSISGGHQQLGAAARGASGSSCRIPMQQQAQQQQGQPGTTARGGPQPRRFIHACQAATTGMQSSTGGVSGASAASSGASSVADGRPRVCILGGGFGGLYTAIKLELLMWPKGKKPHITLVDQGERFIFKPLLYELLNGTAAAWEVAPTFAQLLAPYPIQFVQDAVLHVTPEQTLADGGSATGGVVQLASGATLPYDWLVVALGACADPKGVPGIRECARPFVTLADAEFVAGRLAAFEARAAMAQQPPATIAIVGAGYAGCELAAVVAERMRGKASVLLLTPGPMILEAAPTGQREAAEQTLRDLGVSIMTGMKAVGVEKVSAAAATAAAAAAVAGELAEAAAIAEVAAEASGRPQSPQAAAVEPLAVLAAAVAATSVEASTAAGAAAAAAGGDAGSGSAAANSSGMGSGPSASNSSSSSSSSSSSATSSGAAAVGADSDAGASYVVQLEPVWRGSSSSLAADLVLWTAGAQAASKPLQPFPLSARGQLETDPTLQVVRHARVFALGDVARSTSSPTGDGGDGGGSFYPATAQVAFQQADYAAWNIWAGINGRPLLPFRYQHLGDMMSLGATNAAVALPVQLPADVTASISGGPLGGVLAAAGIRLGGNDGSSLTLEGPLAQLLRRAAYLYRQPTNEQRFSVAASWIEQAVTTAARLAAEASAAGGRGSSRGGDTSAGTKV